LIVPLLALVLLQLDFFGIDHDGKTIAGVFPNEWISALVGGILFSQISLHR